MKNKKLIFGAILFAAILTTGIILVPPSVEWPDPKGCNISTVQNV